MANHAHSAPHRLEGTNQKPSTGFANAGRTLPLIALCIGAVVFVVLLYSLFDVLLLAFAGILLAITVRAPADWLARYTRLTPSWALALVIGGLVLVLAGTGWIFGHGIAIQLDALWQRLPELVHDVRSRMADFAWLFDRLLPDKWLSGGTAVGRGIGAILATFGTAVNMAIVLFIGLFFAVQPRLYIGGFLRLIPRSRRERAGQVLAAIGDILRSWVMGQLLLMSAVAVVTGIGLAALDVPLALALALLAGLLEFIPYIGPLVAAVPALLVALGESPALAGWVLLLYIGIQAVEGNLLQPLVQQRAVYLAPALILLGQLVFGILAGPLGIVLATPLAASALVTVRMLYIEDVLGEK